MRTPACPYIHKRFSYRVDFVGMEAEPVLVIDNFLADAESLVELAVRSDAFQPSSVGYPGVRSPAPDNYLVVLREAAGDLIRQTFGLEENNIVGAQADFSMVTTAPDQLRPVQRIPHFDSTKRSELAAVHFLCSGEHGGTGFYRHRSTGYEYVDQTRSTRYREMIEEDVKRLGMPLPRYMNGSNDLFERIVSYDAAFNRILIYRCTSLHSGNIAKDSTFDTDPRSGRLSINTFIFCHD